MVEVGLCSDRELSADRILDMTLSSLFSFFTWEPLITWTVSLVLVSILLHVAVVLGDGVGFGAVFEDPECNNLQMFNVLQCILEFNY